MPIIAKVGRTSFRTRVLDLLIHGVLLLGAFSIVYPFLIMLSGSVKSDLDMSSIDVVPAYLYDDAILFPSMQPLQRRPLALAPLSTPLQNSAPSSRRAYTQDFARSCENFEYPVAAPNWQAWQYLRGRVCPLCSSFSGAKSRSRRTPSPANIGRGSLSPPGEIVIPNTTSLASHLRRRYHPRPGSYIHSSRLRYYFYRVARRRLPPHDLARTFPMHASSSSSIRESKILAKPPLRPPEPGDFSQHETPGRSHGLSNSRSFRTIPTTTSGLD
jgi:hypothetical protein